ncbi:MAG: tetratricopeptide repeat protein [Bacteroidetes bacterium]|nr:tetratricopeptide repeat protein [Bacteroidota bacterium]
MENVNDLLVKPEYKGTGIYKNIYHKVEYHELNLPEELSEQFNSWIGWFWDNFYNPEDFDHLAHYDHGRKLAIKLKEFVGDKHKVFYDRDEILANNWKVYFEKGEKVRMHGAFQEAEEWYLKAIELEPKDPKLYFNLGTVCIDQKKFDEAILAFEFCLELNPEHAGAYNNMGLAYSEMDEYHLAIKYLIMALKYTDDEDTKATIYSNIGLKYYTLENYHEATKYYDHSLRLRPNDLETLLYAAFSYKFSSKFEKAKNAFIKLIELEPENSEHYYDLAIIEFENYGNIRECFQLLEKAIEINPNDPAAYYNLAEGHLNNEEPDAVIKVFLRAVENGPELTEYFHHKGILFEPEIDFLKVREALKIAASKGDEKAAKWLRENHEHIKLHFKKGDFAYRYFMGKAHGDSRSNLKLLKFEKNKST